MATAHEFEFNGITGGRIRLSDFTGSSILIVNTASECGFTPQYSDLEALWRSHRDKGLVVVGVPSNDFGEQEPGDETDILEFCQNTYRVTFPMTEKYHVIGSRAHPFYKWAAEQLGEDMAPRWNFHKYLIDPGGRIAGVWPSQVKPRDPEIGEVLQEILLLSRKPERLTFTRN